MRGISVLKQVVHILTTRLSWVKLPSYQPVQEGRRSIHIDPESLLLQVYDSRQTVVLVNKYVLIKITEGVVCAFVFRKD
jgi:hypothetical protein